MKYLIYEKETGNVVSRGEATYPPKVLSHHGTIEVTEFPKEFGCVRVVEDQVIDEISPEYFNGLKRKKVAALESARDARLLKGVACPYGTFQADDISRANVVGAVSMAMLAKSAEQPYEIVWRLADNGYVTLDADSMITVGVIVGRFVAQAYGISFLKKDEILTTTTATELDAVNIGEDIWDQG